MHITESALSRRRDGARASPVGDALFLPDFCDIRMVFAVVVVGELLAIILVLNPTRELAEVWRDLALTSLFIQWVGLTSTGLLCLLRPWLRRLSNPVAGTAGYALILVVTAALSEAAYWLVVARVVSLDLQAAWQVGAEMFWFSQPQPVPMAPATTWHAEFLLRNLAVGAIVSALALRYFYVAHQWRTNLESEARARIQALQSRIRPHFLFNSMNTIASLTRSQPALAEQITEDLAELFRESLSDAGIPTTLGRELEVCRQYLRIEAQRLGDRVHARFEVDALPGDALLPRLSLQPLLENAVYHGIEPMTEGGRIELVGRRDGSALRIEIRNTLPGPDAAGRARRGNRLAQDNVAQRLEAFFGGRAGLEVRHDGVEYVVVLRFPYLEEAP